MKNANDTIGNRTRDLPACSKVPQPTAPQRTPLKDHDQAIYKSINKGSNKTAMPNDGGLDRNMLLVCKQDTVLQ